MHNYVGGHQIDTLIVSRHLTLALSGVAWSFARQNPPHPESTSTPQSNQPFPNHHHHRLAYHAPTPSIIHLISTTPLKI